MSTANLHDATNKPLYGERLIEESKIILQSLPLCIHEISLEGKLLRMNKAGVEMLGLMRETDIIGEDYVSYVSNQDKKRIEKLLKSSPIITSAFVPQPAVELFLLLTQFLSRFKLKSNSSVVVIK